MIIGVPRLLLLLCLCYGFKDALGSAEPVQEPVKSKDESKEKVQEPKLTAGANFKVKNEEPSKLAAVAEVKVASLESQKISGAGDLKVYLVKPPQEGKDASIKGVHDSEISHESLALLKGDSGNKDASTTITDSSVTSSSAPSPTPAVPDEKGDWMLNYSSSASICTRLVGEIKINVGYIKANNETGESEIIVPKNATASGSCNGGSLVLSWRSKTNSTKKDNSVQFAFNLDNATQIWRVMNISGSVIAPIPTKTSIKHHSFTFFNNNTCFFNAHVGMSYLCLKSNSYNLSLNSTSASAFNLTTGTLTFSELQIEAYKPESPNNIAFGSPNNCEVTPDMVPIAVGCALAGLVVIVLVAYLIAQRKPPVQGYRSV